MHKELKASKPLLFLAIAALVALALTGIRPASAAPATGAPSPGHKPLDAREVEAFFEARIPARLESEHIAGAVVTVVQGDAILFSKGYGLADVDAGRAIDPATTVFRLASLTKLFTATAVMQQVEAGNLDLDADVNRYLDFTIPAAYPEPVTVLDLLNHTAGFEDWYIGSRIPEDDPFPTLHTVLAANLPERVYPPGSFTSYSNYGMALAGYLVERVTGTGYSDYIEAEIFARLGMAQSSAVQPLPAELRASEAISYDWQNDRFVPQPFERVVSTPSGGLSASAHDIGRFMIAHLNHDYPAENPLLNAQTLDLMHTRSFSNDSRFNGVAHGFWEREFFGEHLLTHSGDLDHSATLLMLLPEHHTGLFIAFNQHGTEVNALRRELWTEFKATFYGEDYYPEPVTARLTPTDPSALAGLYLTTRTPHRSPDRLGLLFGMFQTIHVRVGPENSLLIGDDRYVEVAPLLFQWTEDIGYQSYVAFEPLEEGGYQLLANNLPEIVFRPIAWYESPALNLALLGVVVLLCIGTIISEGFALWRSNGSADLLRWLALALALISLGILVCLALALRNPGAVAIGIPLMLHMTMVLAWLTPALLLAFTLILAIRWPALWPGWPRRLHYGLLASLGVLFCMFLVGWNLLA